MKDLRTVLCIGKTQLIDLYGSRQHIRIDLILCNLRLSLQNRTKILYVRQIRKNTYNQWNNGNQS